MTEQPISETWGVILDLLRDDPEVTPMLQGFLSLVEPKGIAGATLYLEVRNDLTASILNQRMRIPLLRAMDSLTGSATATSFYVVVNPELEPNDGDVLPPFTEVFSEPSETHITAPPIFDAAVPKDPHQTRLNPKYAFESFVIGQSNQFAHATPLPLPQPPP